MLVHKNSLPPPVLPQRSGGLRARAPARQKRAAAFSLAEGPARLCPAAWLFASLLELVLLQPLSQVIPGAGRSIFPRVEPRPSSLSRPSCPRPAQKELTLASSQPTWGWAGTHAPPPASPPHPGALHRNSDKGQEVQSGTLWRGSNGFTGLHRPSGSLP